MLERCLEMYNAIECNVMGLKERVPKANKQMNRTKQDKIKTKTIFI